VRFMFTVVVGIIAVGLAYLAALGLMHR
jgi:hypothetical protein